MKLRCEICSELIAVVNAELLALPLTSAMFGSPDAPHGVPPPFNPGLTWQDFRCPFGPHRPIILPERILTDLGYVEVTKDGATVLDDGLDEATRAVRDRGAAEEACARVARGNLGLLPKITEAVEQRGGGSPERDPANLQTTAFTCSICGKEFREKRFLGSHMHKKHPEAKDAGAV